MLLPGSRIWFEGAASDLVGLADEIRSSRLSGHMVVEFQDSSDALICFEGALVRAFGKVGPRILAGRDPREILDRCRSLPGRLFVFALPPRLAGRLRGLDDRRLMVSGTASAGFDPGAVLRDRKSRRFTGVVDCVSPEGKLLLDFEAGEIVGCWYTAFAGPGMEGLEAFRAWHRGFLRARRPSYFFRSAVGSERGAELWEDLLLDYAEKAPCPLPSSIERLALELGREAAPGSALSEPRSGSARAVFLISGEAASPGAGGEEVLGPGSLIGLDGILGLAPPGAAARALTPCRYLSFGRDDLPLVVGNSPALAERCLRAAADAGPAAKELLGELGRTAREIGRPSAAASGS